LITSSDSFPCLFHLDFIGMDGNDIIIFVF